MTVLSNVCLAALVTDIPVEHIGKKKYINPMKTVEKEVILALEETSVI